MFDELATAWANMLDHQLSAFQAHAGCDDFVALSPRVVRNLGNAWQQR